LRVSSYRLSMNVRATSVHRIFEPVENPMAKANKSNGQDAIALLKTDHRKVEDLFKRYEKSKNDDDKGKLAKEICLELSVHTSIEEEIFYPAVKAAVEEEIHDEAYVEHDGAKVLIAELLDGRPDDDFYDAKVTVLSEMIKHHVKEEEQPGGLFAQARKGDVDFDELGQRMIARKESLSARLKSDGIPIPVTRSMKGSKLQRSKPID
jgi:hemerythrin superfamily protein